MIWKEVEEKYGKHVAEAMKDSKYLECITCTMTKRGEVDIPERDIELAYREITGGYIHPLEWD